jgi:hypothetical protein
MTRVNITAPIHVRERHMDHYEHHDHASGTGAIFPKDRRQTPKLPRGDLTDRSGIFLYRHAIEYEVIEF